MLKVQSEEIAEQNGKAFNACLRSLAARQGGGIEYYQVRGSTIIEYDTLENKLYRSIDLHGYRPHSLCAKQYLTASEENDMYQEVALGLADIYIVSSYTGDLQRVWHGVFNMTPRARKVIA